MKKLQTILTILLAAALLTGCAVSAATLPTTPETLTREEAQAIALADAGLTVEAVTGLQIRWEMDDGVPEYEVEFRSGNYEYDYSIHAESGAIRSREKDLEPPRSTTPPQTLPAATEPPAAEAITPEQAADIALAYAGLDRTGVTDLRTESDRDDGIPVYEVEFCHEKREYSVEIHVKTGAVLDYEYDRCGRCPG